MELYVPFITLKSPLVTALETALNLHVFDSSQFPIGIFLNRSLSAFTGAEVGAAELQRLQSI